MRLSRRSLDSATPCISVSIPSERRSALRVAYVSRTLHAFRSKLRMRRRIVLWPLPQRLARLGANIGVQLANLIIGQALEARHALLDQRTALEQGAEAAKVERDGRFPQIG